MSQKLSRRDLLKLLAAATGAAAISSVPNKWVTPIVEIGALPAHAQLSQLPGAIAVTIVDNSSPVRANPPTKVNAPAPPGCADLCGVTVTGPSPSLATLSTCFSGGGGSFTFTPLVPGSYSVTCTNGPNCNGCNIAPSATQNATVVSGKNTSISFTLG